MQEPRPSPSPTRWRAPRRILYWIPTGLISFAITVLIRSGVVPLGHGRLDLADMQDLLTMGEG